MQRYVLGRTLVRPYHRTSCDEINKIERWFDKRRRFHREYTPPIKNRNVSDLSKTKLGSENIIRSKVVQS